MYYSERFPIDLRHALDVLWLAGLGVIVGWYARFRAALLSSGVVIIAALVFVPPLAGGQPSSVLEVACAILGTGIGALIRRLTLRSASP